MNRADMGMTLDIIEKLPAEIQWHGFRWILIITRPGGKWCIRYMYEFGWYNQAPDVMKFDKIEDAIVHVYEWLKEEVYK
jgi:hypothetical protein